MYISFFLFIYLSLNHFIYVYVSKGNLRGVISNMLGWVFKVSEFELQSSNYVHFSTNTLRKGKNPLIPFAIN